MPDPRTVEIIAVLLYIPLIIFYMLGSWYASHTENKKALRRMQEGKWDIE